jgi:hypothetical protein
MLLDKAASLKIAPPLSAYAYQILLSEEAGNRQ